MAPTDWGAQVFERIRPLLGRIPERWCHHWPVFPIVLAALVVRTYDLFPTFFYGDDAEYATVASYLANNPADLSYPRIEGLGATPFVSQPPLLLYLFGWTGGLVGDAEVGAVLTSVVLGTATVGAVYAIGALVRGRAFGAFAGAFLAVFPSHVTMSRKAYLDAGLTFFMTATVLLFLLWLERRTLRLAWLTGLAMAATIFSKLPGVLVIVPLLAGLAWEAVVLLRPSLWPAPGVVRRYEARLLAKHAAAAVAPTAVFGAAYLGLLFSLRSTVDLVRKLGWQLGRVDPGATSRTPSKPWHWYLTSDPWGVPSQLGLVLAVFATIGLVLFLLPVLRERRISARRLTLAMWPIAILLFFTVSSRKEWFYIVPLAPPVALLAALPADHAFGRLRDWARDLPQAGGRVRAVAGAALLLVGVPGFAPTHTTVHAIGEVEDSYGAGVKEAALLVHELDPEAAQVGTLLGRFTIHFYNRQPTYHWFVDHGFVEREIEAGRVRFMVLDKHLDIARETAWMEDLAARHDARLVRTWQAWGGHDVVWLYEFPRANLNATPPATAAAATRAETEGTLPLPTNSGPWSTPTPDKAV